MSTIERVRQSLTWRQSPKKCASRIGISLNEYLQLKDQILKQLEGTSPKIVERVTSTNYNLDEGTGRIEGILEFEPLSASEIETKFKIDTKQWRLVQYWNKEKPGGGYFISANIARVKLDDVSVANLQDSIAKIFSTLPITPHTAYPTITNKKSLFIYTSDKHIGAYVSDKAIYENNYDRNTFSVRMKALLHEIFYLTTTMGAFDDIFILDLGDSLDGLDAKTTRGGHSLPQNMSNKEAFETYLSVHKEFYDILVRSAVAANYHVYSVTEDNHSGDFGYFATRSLEVYLNTAYPQVETRVMEKFMEHFTHGEHTFIITHGKDSEDMKHGFPLVLNDKAENFINKYIKYHNITSPHIHFIKGDLHQESSQETGDFRYRNVLSMFGSSKWMMNNFSSRSKGGCSIEIIEPATSRVFQHSIRFT